MVSQVLRSCARCGTPGDGPDGGMPEGWSLDVDPDRGVQYLCGTCTRDNVRSIEAKLPQEWWE